jgi:tripartite-type tricarboxylate transporter receptor subunit TctC
MRCTGLLCLFAAVAATLPAAAQSPESFWRGKQVRFILGAAPGQDYDLWARLLARHWPRHIPGNPTLVVENMPGAGHLIATNYLYNKAPRDGSAIGMVTRNIPNAAVMHINGVLYDPQKFGWIGSPERVNRGCFAMAGSAVQRPEDLYTKELIVGGTGAGSSVSETPVLLKNLLGMRFKLVEGYVKPQDAVLAMERGEVEGICFTVQSLEQARPGWIAAGKVRVLFTLEHERVPQAKAPVIFDFVTDAAQRAVLDFYSSSIEMGRPILAPPDVPADRLAALRRAFDRTMEDAAFREEALGLKLEIGPETGEALQAIVARAMATPQAVVSQAERMTQGEFRSP